MKGMRRERAFRSMEELARPPPEREEMEGASSRKPSEEKVTVKERERESQVKKTTEIEGKTLGLQIITAESRPFPKQVTYEMIMERIKAGDYKFTYTAKKTDQEILQMIEKKKVKIFEDDLKIISDESFRKVRGGKEPTPPSKQTKK